MAALDFGVLSVDKLRDVVPGLANFIYHHTYDMFRQYNQSKGHEDAYDSQTATATATDYDLGDIHGEIKNMIATSSSSCPALQEKYEPHLPVYYAYRLMYAAGYMNDLDSMPDDFRFAFEEYFNAYLRHFDADQLVDDFARYLLYKDVVLSMDEATKFSNIITRQEISKITRQEISKYTENAVVADVCDALLENRDRGFMWYVSFVGLDTRHARLLAFCLAWNTSCERLSIEGGRLGAEGASALARSLYCNSTLKSLWLSDECCGDEGASAFAMALDRNSTLESLWLSGDNCGDAGVSALARALERNSTLNSFKLSRNCGDKSASALAKMLERNSTLESLDLTGNHIGPEGASVLAMALERNVSLESFMLCINEIGSVGASAVAKVLERNSTLKELDLFYCEVGPGGASALARMLKCNSTLKELNLMANGIGDEGVSALACALESNSSLLELDVFDNDFGVEGVSAMARAVMHNSSLEKVIGMDLPVEAMAVLHANERRHDELERRKMSEKAAVELPPGGT